MESDSDHPVQDFSADTDYVESSPHQATPLVSSPDQATPLFHRLGKVLMYRNRILIHLPLDQMINHSTLICQACLILLALAMYKLFQG